MKKYLFIIAAAATVLAACTKELKELSNEDVRNDVSGKTYIEAFNENAVEEKAFVDDATAAFTWSTGDQIAVFSGETYYISEELPAAYDDKATAAFSFEDDINSGRSDFAVYPANLVHTGVSARTSAVRKHTAAELSVTFPKEYTLAQLQGEQSPAPRIAVNAPGQGLQFKSISALLRISVNAVSKDCDYITIQFPGKKVNGEFVMTDFAAGTSGVALAASSKESEEIIKVSELNGTFAESLVLNIPVPMGVAGSQEYGDIKVTAWDADGVEINHIVTPVKLVQGVPTAWAPGRKAARKLNAYLPTFTASGTNIDDPERTVLIFAPGNLQAKLDTVPTVTISGGNRSKSCAINNFGTASAWRFAEHQYESIHNSILPGRTYSTNGLEGAQKGDWIDLFAWQGDDLTNTKFISYDEEYKFGIYYGSSSGSSSYLGATTGKLKHDWGEHVITYKDEEISYAANTWRTPTQKELETIMSKRVVFGENDTTVITHAAKATLIAGPNDTVTRGLIIFPDHYIHPYGVNPIVKAYGEGNKTYDATTTAATANDNIYTLEDWAKMEDAGCAFLPVTDQRNYSDDPALQTNNAGCGFYWTSTLNKTSLAFTLAFNCPESGRDVTFVSNSGGTNNVQLKYSRSRYYGEGVRLVRALK